MNKIKLKYTPDEKWREFYGGDWDIAILIGGRGSGKTWNAGNFCTLQTFADPEYRTLVLRDVASSIQQSILQNIKGRFQFIMEKTGGAFDSVFEVQENQIKSRAYDLVNVLTKGFRTSRVDQKADLKGFEDINLAILEEAEDMRDEERVNTLIDTLRKDGYKVVIILNTPDLEHWIIQRYFDYEKSEFDGFYTIKPKKADRVLQVITDYRDNPHLAEQTKKKYAAYNDPQSPTYNPDYYAHKILGLATEYQNASRKFDLTKVLAIQTQQPMDIVENVKRYKDPEQKIYSLSIDPSSGLGSDYTAITMREMGEGYPLVAQMKAKTNEIQTAEIAAGLANIFERNGGKVYIACEINGLGRAVMNELLRIFDVKNAGSMNAKRFYKRFIKDPTAAYNSMSADFGWQTNSANRDVMITEFAHLFQLDQLEVLNEDEKDEMRTFIWNDAKNRYEAQENQHDDLLFSDMICIQNMKYIARYG